MKTKVKTFNDVFVTVFWNDRVLKESAHYVCVAVKVTDSVLKVEKNNYTQFYSKECKYQIKKKKVNDL